MTDSAEERPRLADRSEARTVADLWIASRDASFPSNPRRVHDDDDIREHFATVVLACKEVWVLGAEGAPIALAVLGDGWLDHLMVHPDHWRRGLGTTLLEHAQRQQRELDLWTFQSNEGARRLYERHGFELVAMTEGDNEEGAPDVRYHWQRD